MILAGFHALAHDCRGQAVIAIFSGEAEFYGAVSLISELCGLRSLALDWNVLLQLSVTLDAEAAIGMASRRGLGRVKHVGTIYFLVDSGTDREDEDSHPESAHEGDDSGYADQVPLATGEPQASPGRGV